MKWQLTTRAELDLAEIFSYSFNKWGFDQAFKYDGEIEDAIIGLAKDPQSGRPIHNVSQDYRKKVVNSHFIIYEITGQGITVLRILYQGMDIKRHL